MREGRNTYKGTREEITISSKCPDKGEHGMEGQVGPEAPQIAALREGGT
jgi:hypothetical protein